MHHKLLLHPDLYFGEAYTNGSVLIENGSLTEFLEIILKNVGRGEINFYSRALNQIKGFYRSLTNFNLIKKSKQNVAHHYDISEKLYDLFLDKNRQYSCAYFKNEKETLEQAQENKMNHIIKKLNLKPNQRVLDIGSGWGTLAIEIAKKSKCEVVGITLSENQLKYSKQKAKELNLENQVDFRLIDYRQLNEKFDRIVVWKKSSWKCSFDLFTIIPIKTTHPSCVLTVAIQPLEFQGQIQAGDRVLEKKYH